jgi:ribonuclease G
MKREILISGTQREIRVAILEDDQLVELQVDRPEARRMIGDIYLGKVEAVLPGIQAAFVNIGTEKSAFLHSSDLVFDEDGDDDDDDDDEGDDEGDDDRTAGEADVEQPSSATDAVSTNGNGESDSPYADAPAPRGE